MKSIKVSKEFKKCRTLLPDCNLSAQIGVLQTIQKSSNGKEEEKIKVNEKEDDEEEKEVKEENFEEDDEPFYLNGNENAISISNSTMIKFQTCINNYMSYEMEGVKKSSEYSTIMLVGWFDFVQLFNEFPGNMYKLSIRMKLKKQFESIKIKKNHGVFGKGTSLKCIVDKVLNKPEEICNQDAGNAILDILNQFEKIRN